MLLRTLVVLTKSPHYSSDFDGGSVFAHQLLSALPRHAEYIDALFCRHPSADLEHLPGVRRTMFHCPSTQGDSRFTRRLNDSAHIEKTLGDLLPRYDTVLILHVSNGFGLARIARPPTTRVLMLPMFTGASYRSSGEFVPDDYLEAENAALRSCDGILSPSPTEANQISTCYGIPATRIVVVPRGIDTSLFHPRETSAKMSRNRIHLAYPATIKPQKNQRDCIPLVHSLRRMGIDPVVHLIGGIGCPHYHADLAATIREQSLGAHVVLHGLQPRDKVAAIVQSCDYGISTTRFETFGKGIYETMAAGLPTFIYHDVCAVWDYLNDGEGAIAIARSPQALARRIVELHSQPEQIIAMQRCARNVAQRFDQNACVADLCKAINALRSSSPLK